MAKEKEEEKSEEAIKLVEVPTQTAPAVELPNGKVIGIEEYLVWLGNLVYKISKNITN